MTLMTKLYWTISDELTFKKNVENACEADNFDCIYEVE